MERGRDVRQGLQVHGARGRTLTMQFTNVFNHFQPSDPASLTLTTPQNFGESPVRSMPLGNGNWLAVHF